MEAVVAVALAVAVILPFALFPNLTWATLMFVDFIIPFMGSSDVVASYHLYLVQSLPNVSPVAIAEIPYASATYDSIRVASKDYTVPIIVRGALAGLPGVTQGLFSDWSWWYTNYGNETVKVSYIYAIYSTFILSYSGAHPYVLLVVSLYVG